MQDIDQIVAGDRASRRDSGEEAPAASLWLRQAREWLQALTYRPERRYMRGEQRAATMR